MLYPILPLFLTEELGASAALVGSVEGVARAIQNVAQGLSGRFSDHLRRRKRIALAGYALAAISKPLIGLSMSWAHVLAARSLDRLGAGTRSAPRDALIAASVDDAHRGKAFGLEGLGDNLGACLGPLLAVALLGWFGTPLRSMFFVSFIPGVLAVVMVLFVRERASLSPPKMNPGAGRLPRNYWKALAAFALFGIGNSSNSFLILRIKGLGVSFVTTILVYAAFNFVAALASYPAGHLSDTMGRRRLLLLSIFVFVVVYAGIGLTSNVGVIAVLFALYGVHQGVFRSVGKALVTDFVGEELRATAIGWYTTVIGLAELVASVVGGQLWIRIGPQATFVFGAIVASSSGVAASVLVVPRPAR
jgi:MFS family permease